jgi:cell fate (sporulation/competence/biofilm development) regulator YlbF (YheA/YmcA/DUF963 family)
MATLNDMARQLGNTMARTEEYQALQRAVSAGDDDRELVEARNAMGALEQRVAEVMQGGTEPDAELRSEYEAMFMRLQANSSYQRLIAAQTNFDKILVVVNETITQGMEEGATSRIILSS